MFTLWTLPGIDVMDNDERTAIVEFNLTDWYNSTIKLQVTWKNPYQLSRNGLLYADVLKIAFDFTELFVSVNGRSFLPNNTIIGFRVPKQETLEAMLQQQAAEDTAETVMDVLAGGNLILNILFAFSLKFLWGFVNML